MMIFNSWREVEFRIYELQEKKEYIRMHYKSPSWCPTMKREPFYFFDGVKDTHIFFQPCLYTNLESEVRDFKEMIRLCHKYSPEEIKIIGIVAAFTFEIAGSIQNTEDKLYEALRMYGKGFWNQEKGSGMIVEGFGRIDNLPYFSVFVRDIPYFMLRQKSDFTLFAGSLEESLLGYISKLTYTLKSNEEIIKDVRLYRDNNSPKISDYEVNKMLEYKLWGRNNKYDNIE